MKPGRKQVLSASRYTGVAFDGKRGSWRVRVTVGGQQHWVGRFKNEAEASMAHDCAALVLVGEKACLNHGAEAAKAAMPQFKKQITRLRSCCRAAAAAAAAKPKGLSGDRRKPAASSAATAATPSTSTATAAVSASCSTDSDATDVRLPPPPPRTHGMVLQLRGPDDRFASAHLKAAAAAASALSMPPLRLETSAPPQPQLRLFTSTAQSPLYLAAAAPAPRADANSSGMPWVVASCDSSDSSRSGHYAGSAAAWDPAAAVPPSMGLAHAPCAVHLAPGSCLVLPHAAWVPVPCLLAPAHPPPPSPLPPAPAPERQPEPAAALQHLQHGALLAQLLSCADLPSLPALEDPSLEAPDLDMLLSLLA